MGLGELRPLLMVLVGLGVVGCGEAVFECASAEDCSGKRVGFCEPNGYCSFGDPDCPSGRRYGEFAGGGLANTCTEEEGTTGTSVGDASSMEMTGAMTTVGSSSTVSSGSTESGSETTDAAMTGSTGSTMSIDDSTGDASSGGMSSSGNESSSSTGLSGPFTMSFGDRTDADVQGVTVDSSIASWDVTINLGAHGDMHVQGGGDTTEVGLLRIEVSSLPLAAQVSAVELRVWNMDFVADGEVDLHVVSEYWAEGTADVAAGVCNWNDRDEGVPWTTAGAGEGSYVDDTLDSFTPNAAYTEHVLSIPPEVVEAWRDDPGGNYGILMHTGNLSGPVYIGTREQAEEAYRPLLVVTYYH